MKNNTVESEKRPYFFSNEIIAEIAKDTNIRTEVVETVVRRLIDISIEKMANGEKFSFGGIFNTSYGTRAVHIKRTARGGGTHNGGMSVWIPEMPTIRARLSPKLHKLYRLQQGQLKDKKYLVNRDTWVGALGYFEELKKIEQEKRKNSTDYNPIDYDEVEKVKSRKAGKKRSELSVRSLEPTEKEKELYSGRSERCHAEFLKYAEEQQQKSEELKKKFEEENAQSLEKQSFSSTPKNPLLEDN